VEVQDVLADEVDQLGAGGRAGLGVGDVDVAALAARFLKLAK
jgi:hypothetical protein